jgi:predicted ribosomally synthesized peptide with nif11-like leader
MSEDQLNAFIEKVKADTSLQEKLKVAGDADAVVAIAIEAGFGISADDLRSAQSEASAELKASDEELEGAAGGSNAEACFYLCIKNPILSAIANISARTC